MITRGLRVCEQFEGQGITRELKNYAECKVKEHGAERKSMTFGFDYFLQKVLNENKRIVFRKVF